MKENKIISVVEHSGERIEGKAAKESNIKCEKANITIEIGDNKRTFEGMNLHVVVGLQRGDEADRMHCSVNGKGDVEDFARILNGMRKALGDRMFQNAVLAEAMLQLKINAAEYDAEEEE